MVGYFIQIINVFDSITKYLLYITNHNKINNPLALVLVPTANALTSNLEIENHLIWVIPFAMNKKKKQWPMPFCWNVWNTHTYLLCIVHIRMRIENPIALQTPIPSNSNILVAFIKTQLKCEQGRQKWNGTEAKFCWHQITQYVSSRWAGFAVIRYYLKMSSRVIYFDEIILNKYIYPPKHLARASPNKSAHSFASFGSFSSFVFGRPVKGFRAGLGTIFQERIFY